MNNNTKINDMNKEKYKRIFNKYTKEQIIEGILNTYFFESEIKNLLDSIEHYVKQKRIDDEFKELKRLTDNSNNATDDYINYLNVLKQKYGDKFKIGQLTTIELDELSKVTFALDKANKEYLENLEKDIKRYN